MKWGRYTAISIAQEDNLLLINGTVALLRGRGTVTLTDAPFIQRIARPKPPEKKKQRREGRLLTAAEFRAKENQNESRYANVQQSVSR